MKVCPWCAEELADDARVCTQCGKDPDEMPEWKRVAADRHAPAGAGSTAASELPGRPAGSVADRTGSNRLARLAFAIVVVSFAIGFLFPRVEFSVATDAVGVALGVVALRQIRDAQGAQRGSEWAITAVALGGLGMALFLISLAVG